MKKCTLIAFFFLAAIALQAQNFKAGLVGGISGGQIDGDRWTGYNKMGFIAGGYISYRFSKNIGAQLGFDYIGKGAKQSVDSDNGINASYKTHLNYIEVPLTFNYYLSQYSFFFRAGINPGYLLSAKRYENKVEVGGNYEFESVDISVLGAVGYNFNEHLIVDINFSYSVLPIANDPNQFNRLLCVMLCYEF